MLLLPFRYTTPSQVATQLGNLVDRARRIPGRLSPKMPSLLKHLDAMGKFELGQVEKFVMKLYNLSTRSTDVNSLQVEMFHRVGDLEKLPPTQDALIQHLLRCEDQWLIWCSPHIVVLNQPPAEGYGWKFHQQQMTPVLMTQDPMPTSCRELFTCKCTTSKYSSSR